ncbi:MAG: hypothetical protein U5N58_05075 [Actinomycetota bacterium]|nr:hypothetical protein [Actinomycetota bacterium]
MIITIIHVGGTYLLPSFDGNGAAKLFQIAQSKDKITSMDVTYDTEGRWLSTIKPCLKAFKILDAQLRQAEITAGEKKPEDIAIFRQNEGVQIVIIKLGPKRGCYVKGAGEGFYSSL